MPLDFGRRGPLAGAEGSDAGHPETDRLERLRLWAAALAATAGLAILAGWTFKLAWLITPVGGVRAADPVAATAIILAAGALLLGPRRHKWPVRILASLLMVTGAFRLAAIFGSNPFQIDRLLFADRVEIAGSVSQGTMTPGAAVSLLLLGAALFLSASRDRRASHVAQFLCAAAAGVCTYVIVEYGLDLLALRGALRVDMSFYAALGVIALAVGIASISAETGMTRLLLDRRSGGTLARTVIPFVILTAVLFGTEGGSGAQVCTNMLVTALLLAGCFAALFRAERARRRHEAATAVSEAHYRHAEQVGHIGHWQIETATGALMWSDGVFEIYGLPREMTPLLETKFALYHPDDRESQRRMVKTAIQEGRDWEVDHRILRPDGKIRHVKSLGVCQRDTLGVVKTIFGVLIDTTELELARRQAEAAAASKAAFLANMSHEIRTPMNGVMGFVELLMESKLDGKQRRHLLLVQESAKALLKLLNDILDLSKMEAGQLDLSAEPSNVRHDITQCVRLMTPAAEQKGLDLRVRFAGGFPKSVLIDSLRLRQILFNLLGNAVKFTSRGSVTVTLEEEAGPGEARSIVIQVADTGVGIAEERKTAIFDAFVQADASTSRRFGGSGLGLSISRRLAALMGGTIALESREGEGTLVTLTLPLDEVFAPALADIATPKLPDRAEALAAKRQVSILLVEDIDINQELITEMLQRLGHKVELAENGKVALDLAARLEVEPDSWDMILMDVQMPVMDGLTATRAIRALGGRATTIPIVALTANAFAVEIQECSDAGMNDHVAKPSGLAQLKQMVDLWGNVAQSPAPVVGFAGADIGCVADRFDARLRKSTDRLAELVAQLPEVSNSDTALTMLREAASIAHVLAGTAGMFGRASLGKVAQQVDADLKAIARDDPLRGAGRAARALEPLLAALLAPAAPVVSVPTSVV
jgi:PAS domain S-box-containing protein